MKCTSRGCRSGGQTSGTLTLSSCAGGTPSVHGSRMGGDGNTGAVCAACVYLARSCAGSAAQASTAATPGTSSSCHLIAQVLKQKKKKKKKKKKEERKEGKKERKKERKKHRKKERKLWVFNDDWKRENKRN